jgi:hypothetical protein
MRTLHAYIYLSMHECECIRWCSKPYAKPYILNHAPKPSTAGLTPVKYNNFNGAYPEPVFNPAAGLTPLRYNPENGQLPEPMGQNGRSKFILFFCVN